ncbi:hypothetical protein Pelo_18165 [Pelomyxa schiedti]|nr:hypothetical protein Pelo_18165 [Pelomyxa schiedti]
MMMWYRESRSLQWQQRRTLKAWEMTTPNGVVKAADQLIPLLHAAATTRTEATSRRQQCTTSPIIPNTPSFLLPGSAATAAEKLSPSSSSSSSSAPLVVHVESSHNSASSTAATSSSSSSSSPATSPCYVGMLPLWVVIECIGKAWVMRPERNVILTLGFKSVEGKRQERRGCGEHQAHLERDRRLFVSLSATLGLLRGGPLSVELPRLVNGGGGGSVAPMLCAAEGQEHSVVIQAVDGESEASYFNRHVLVLMLLNTPVCGTSRGGTDTHDEFTFEPPMCFNSRWIVGVHQVVIFLNKSEYWVSEEPKFYVDHCWPRPYTNILSLPWKRCIVYSVRFFGPSEYNCESDTLEIIFRRSYFRGYDSGAHVDCGKDDDKDGSEEQEDTTEEGHFLCVMHVDLKRATDPLLTDCQKGVLPVGGFHIQCKNPVFFDTLCAPLVDRLHMWYFFPFSAERSQEKLLFANTGQVLTWLGHGDGGGNGSSQLVVQAVDETHMCTTDLLCYKTSVFQLSTPLIKHALPQVSSSTVLRLCRSIQHPPGTAVVITGGGLIQEAPCRPIQQLHSNNKG